MSMRGGLRVLLVVVVIYLVITALAWALQRSLIYLPDASKPSTPDSAVDVTLTTDDGLELGAWLFAPVGVDRESAVLVANGNAGNRGGRVLLAQILARQGFAVLLFDYRGYGGNPGSPHEEGLYADSRAAYAHLTEEAGYSPQRILFFGESLGCGVVAALAAEHPPAGMLLRSPFADLPSAGQRAYPFLPVRMLLSDRFPVADDVVRAEVPLTVVYGTADSVIPPDHSRQVVDAATEA
ncbi:MAG: alpha/beta hydrolase, partial [Stackebrandtia sp.]